MGRGKEGGRERERGKEGDKEVGTMRREERWLWNKGGCNE